MQDDKLPAFSTMQLTSISTNDTWIKTVENVTKEIKAENLNLSVGYTTYGINSKEADYAHSTEEGKTVNSSELRFCNANRPHTCCSRVNATVPHFFC